MDPHSDRDVRQVRRRTAPWTLVALAALLWSVGCSEQSRPEQHVFLSGTVRSIRPESGQLTVKVSSAQRVREADQDVLCLLGSNTEVYINDRYSGFATIEIGDTVELVAYRDPDPGAERFVVSRASITRNVPLPPPPDLSPPATEPTTQPEET